MSKQSSSTKQSDSPKETNNKKMINKTVKVIQEMFQVTDYNGIGYQQALAELDQAVIDRYQFVVIEPQRLGEETARWLLMGDFCHRSTIWLGAFSWLPLPSYVQIPSALVSLGAFAIYTLSWSSDPCSEYTIERDNLELSRINLSAMTSVGSAVVLRRRDDSTRRLVQKTVALITGLTFFYRFYRLIE